MNHHSLLHKDTPLLSQQMEHREGQYLRILMVSLISLVTTYPSLKLVKRFEYDVSKINMLYTVHYLVTL